MIEIIKTYSGVPRFQEGWRGIPEVKAYMTIGYLYRCRTCGDLFTDKTKAKEHTHEKAK